MDSQRQHLSQEIVRRDEVWHAGFGVLMQFTVRPTRFTTASHPSMAANQLSPMSSVGSFRPSQATSFHASAAFETVREKIVTSAPDAENASAIESPRNPLPPAIPIRLPAKSLITNFSRTSKHCSSLHLNRSL
jgi:hypothetical protein